MKRYADEKNTRLLVVVFPVEEQLRLPDRTVQEDLMRYSREHGIEILDLYDSFRAHWRDGLYLDYWEQAHQVDKLHLNERGHELAARVIGEAIRAGAFRSFAR